MGIFRKKPTDAEYVAGMRRWLRFADKLWWGFMALYIVAFAATASLLTSVVSLIDISVEPIVEQIKREGIEASKEFFHTAFATSVIIGVFLGTLFSHSLTAFFYLFQYFKSERLMIQFYDELHGPTDVENYDDSGFATAQESN